MKSFFFHIICLILFFGTILQAQQREIQQQLNKAGLLVYDNPDEAIELLEKLQIGLDESDLDNHIKIMLLLGSAYSSKQNHKEALRYGFEAEELVRNTVKYPEQLKTLGFIANQYYILQIDEKVNEYLDKSEKVIAAHPVPDSVNYLVANIYFIRALNYKDKLDCNFAVNYFNKAIASYKKSDYKNSKINLPIIYIQKGYCFFDQNRLDSADYSFRRAYEISSENEIIYNESYALIGISKVLYKRGDYHSALDTLLRIKRERLPVSVNSEIYKELSENYLKMKDFEQYKTYSERYLDTAKEMEKGDVLSIQNLLELQKKEGDDETKSKNKQYFFLYFLIIFLLVTAVFVTSRLIRKIKSN